MHVFESLLVPLFLSIAQVVLMLLRSYEHMGRARISCIYGCKCSGGSWGHDLPLWGRQVPTSPASGTGFDVDCHAPSEQHGRVSHGASAVLQGVTQASAYVVRVEVLGGSSSGEHKVKVISVTVRAKAPQGGDVH